jgi:DNA-binding NarL/FixJ family response regulator
MTSGELTARQRQILELVGQGRSNKAITFARGRAKPQ